MKYNAQLPKRYWSAAVARRFQGQLPCARCGQFLALITVLSLLPGAAICQVAPANTPPDVASSSPLSILHSAPTVRLDEPTPAYNPVPQEPAYTPATRLRSPAVARDEEPVEPTATPKKDGLMRGMIRAIPFVGSKLAGPRPTSAPTPIRSTHDDEMMNAAEPDTTEAAPTPARLDLNAPDDAAERVRRYGTTGPERPSSIPPAPPAPPLESEQTLTVKVAGAPDSASTSTPVIAQTPSPIATPAKAPEFARSIDQASTATVDIAAAEPATSPTLEAADLGMPNPAYEQNEIIRNEYSEAVKLGRAGKYAEAARAFREYANNHPSSGLAPRALFLAALLEPTAQQAADNEKLLRERFPKSRFLAELEKRNRARAKQIVASPTPLNESPAQMAGRLESELTEAVGAPDREVPLRLQLGQAYLAMEEYDRALEVMRPAVELSRGRQEEPDILILISECYIATRRNSQAVTLLSDVLQRFPAATQRPRALYDFGLVNEASGNFERARTMYTELRQRWPASAEATQAQQRLKDMDRLAE